LRLAVSVPELLTKTNNFKPYNDFTLDDLDRVRLENPDEAAAMNGCGCTNGVLVEAVR